MKRAAAKHNPWEDHYSRRAKKDRYPARSVYKLQEIQQKHALIKKGHNVLDLGCSPGSWLLYAAKLTGASGNVVGVDLKPVTIQIPPHATVIRADAVTLDAESLGTHFHVVLSDMAPATTGHKAVDSARSFALCETALDIARRVLRPGGSFVCKVFQGSDFNHFLNLIRADFKVCKMVKPRSSRKASKELFVVGLEFMR